MNEIIHNYLAGKDEANNYMAYYIENIINFAIHEILF